MQTETRSKIIKKCYEAICAKGFLELRTDKEIKRLRITKGAFYHYFPGKLDLGYAVIEEIIRPMYLDKWGVLTGKMNGIAETLIKIISNEKNIIDENTVKHGDVLGQLMNEMSAHDEEFRLKLESVLEEIVQIIQRAILAGKTAGEIKQNVDARSMAYLIVGSLQGCYAIAKTRNSRDVFATTINTLCRNISDTLFESHISVKAS